MLHQRTCPCQKTSVEVKWCIYRSITKLYWRCKRCYRWTMINKSVMVGAHLLLASLLKVEVVAALEAEYPIHWKSPPSSPPYDVIVYNWVNDFEPITEHCSRWRLFILSIFKEQPYMHKHTYKYIYINWCYRDVRKRYTAWVRRQKAAHQKFILRFGHFIQRWLVN